MKFNNKIQTFFDFSVKDYLGKTINLQNYINNNPVLIVNVASY